MPSLPAARISRFRSSGLSRIWMCLVFMLLPVLALFFHRVALVVEILPAFKAAVSVISRVRFFAVETVIFLIRKVLLFVHVVLPLS